VKAVLTPGKPKLGEVWQQQLVDISSRLYAVVGSHDHVQLTPSRNPPVVHKQHVLLDLELGRVRRVNASSLNSANGWSRFRYRANKVPDLNEESEPREN
jgi:hypothetical protein